MYQQELFFILTLHYSLPLRGAYIRKYFLDDQISFRVVSQRIRENLEEEVSRVSYHHQQIFTSLNHQDIWNFRIQSFEMIFCTHPNMKTIF